MNTWQALIDEGARLCGSQNKLAEAIGCQSTDMAKVRHCKRPLPKEQLEKMAELLGREPAELWEAQELANMPRRNPFRRHEATTAAALIAVILSGLAPTDSVAASRAYSASGNLNTVYIVAHLRRLASRCRQAGQLIGRYILLHHAQGVPAR